MENKVYDVVEGLIQKLKTTQEENVEKTARLFADALKNGGMLQAFGSGHSQAGASELCFRAGGFIPVSYTHLGFRGLRLHSERTQCVKSGAGAISGKNAFV